MSKKQVWVFIENTSKGIADVSKELLSKGKDLAETLQGEVCAIHLGYNIKASAQELFDLHCDKVYSIDHKELKDFRALPYTTNIVNAIKKYSPYIVLFGASFTGRELGPRIASAVKCGLTADCTELKIGDFDSKPDKKVYQDLLLQIRPAFGGNIIATIVNPLMHPQMATVRQGVMKMREPLKKGSGKGEVITIEAEIKNEDLVLEVIEKIQEEKKVDLTGAQIVVAGGMGVGGKENFELIKELAQVLGGEVGATRAVVDAGWIHKDHQVGQTGTTVRPKLYIACGISGSIQHMAGMQESKQIISINTDANAPAMSIAHYKIVGDLKKIIPMMIKAYKEKA
ncbi:MAG TPA: electron transfer flavoprotein subunit alpha [Spirochaetia bacterium]|nr:electron transfer flavoprotein subunit alpha [Spirochaetia bacterium]